MFKRLVIIFLYLSLTAIAAGYFVFADKIRAQNSKKIICDKISVNILDSAKNRFVSKDEVLNILGHSSKRPIGKNINSINLYSIETLLNRRSAIKESQAYIGLNGNLKIDIKQREPIIRIETQNGGFYIDETGYIFPLEYNFTSYVPIVSGFIPINIDTLYRGYSQKGETWINQILRLGNYIDKNEFWNNQIEQIYINENGEIILSPRVGPSTIVFGDLAGIGDKFVRLYAFYNEIIPKYGMNYYSEINLKYKNQIICKKNI